MGLVGAGEGRNLFPRAIQSSGCGFRPTAHTFILPSLIKKREEAASGQRSAGWMATISF